MKKKDYGKSQLATESIGRHHAALVSKSVNRQMGLSPKEQKKRFMNKGQSF